MSQGKDLELACGCGSFRARVSDVRPATGSHLICYCRDCQTSARILGAEEQLKPRGGTDIYHTTPSRISIVKGQEHLACLRLSPKGLLRWYASCCDTPICNTLSSPRLAFVGVLTPALLGDAVAETIGPVIAVVNTQGAQSGPGALKNRGRNLAGWHVLKRHAQEILHRTRAATPFFDKDGQPVVVPRVISLKERKAAQPE